MKDQPGELVHGFCSVCGNWSVAAKAPGIVDAALFKHRLLEHPEIPASDFRLKSYTPNPQDDPVS